ncbi:AAA family ATPase [Streptomyces malaysiensis]|uniref:AAA family ATPase n=1 Tax=Streptomyces malaysiensis TaxID=92644 RepID=UPI003411172D
MRRDRAAQYQEDVGPRSYAASWPGLLTWPGTLVGDNGHKAVWALGCNFLPRGKCMSCIERDRDLELLEGDFADCADGRGRVILISGAPGAGKTELLRTFGERVAAGGGLLVRVSGSPTEQSLGFGVFDQLMRGVASLDGAMGEAVTLLEDHTVQTIPANGDRITPRHAQLTLALLRDLMRLTLDRPVVIGIDDLQYVDSLSLQCLLYLIRRLESMRILVVLTGGPRCQLTYPIFYDEILRQPHARRIQLALLSREGVRRLVTENCENPKESFSDACFELSGGNPLLVHALLSDTAATVKANQRRCVTSPTPGATFREAVLACVYGNGAEGFTIATAIAVLQDRSSPELIGRLCDIDGESLAHTIHALEGAGLMAARGFRHPAIQLAVLEDLPPECRAELRLRAAELLYSAGAPDLEVAAHLVAAGRVRENWAPAVLREAAKQAIGEGAESAAEYLELALHACSDDRERASISTAIAEVEFWDNPGNAIRRFGELLTWLRLGLLSGRDAVFVIGLLLWCGHVAEAERASRSLAASADRLDEEGMAEVRKLPLHLFSWAPAWATDPVIAQTTRREADVASVAVAGDPGRQAVISLNAVLRGVSDDNLVHEAEYILDGAKTAGMRVGVTAHVTNALMTLVYLDRLHLAERWCTVLLKEATTTRDRSLHAGLFTIGAEIAFRLGDLLTAERYSRLALNRLQRESWGVGIGAPVSVQVLAATAMGKHQEAARALQLPVPEAMFQTRFGLHYLYARGHYYLSVDRAHAALKDFQTCGRLMVDWGIDVPSLVGWRAAAAEAYLRLNRTKEARQLSEEQLAKTDSRSRAHGVALRLLAGASKVKVRSELLKQSVYLLEQHGDRLELARSLSELSHVYHAQGEFERSKMLARRSRYLARECHAEVSQLKHPPEKSSEDSEALVFSPVESEGIAGLSEAEQRVAVLAAQGNTNREVARRLHITVSTVEQHLTRAYRKLEINGRSDLPDRIWLKHPEAI